MRFAARTSACRIAVVASTSTIMPLSTSIQIVGGISEECLSAMGSGPSRCRIGRRDELGHHIGRSAEGLIVEHGHIFFDRPSGRFWWQPLLTLAPLLPIGIRLDQTGIDRKGFAAD